jgi:hypothetical protein
LALSRMRIDDEDGLFGHRSGRYHAGTTFRSGRVSK